MNQKTVNFTSIVPCMREKTCCQNKFKKEYDNILEFLQGWFDKFEFKMLPDVADMVNSKRCR